MRLRDRRGGERLLLERPVQILECPAETGLDLLADRGERQAWRVVLQLLERLDPFGREDVLAHREDLAELDVGRAERRQQLREPDRRTGLAQCRVALGRLVEQPLAERRLHQQRPEAVPATMNATVRKRARSRTATPTIEGVSFGLFTGDSPAGSVRDSTSQPETLRHQAQRR